MSPISNGTGVQLTQHLRLDQMRSVTDTKEVQNRVREILAAC